MKYQALATDYDETIAADGRVDDQTVAALRQLREAGLSLILVTGRELADLFNTFAHPALFDRIVAENGAVLYEPRTQSIEVLAEAPPPELVSALVRLNIPVSVGHSIIATVEPYDREVLSLIRELSLEWHVVFNKGSIMALPRHVSKASGLSAALRALSIPHDTTVGVGDAENDVAFLQTCGWSVAVQNALPAVKHMADAVMERPHGEGVIDLADRLLKNELSVFGPDR